MSSFNSHHGRSHPNVTIPVGHHNHSGPGAPKPPFLDSYSFEVTPPTHGGYPEDRTYSNSNSQDSYRLATPDTPRPRALSTTAISGPSRDRITGASADSTAYAAYTEPQVYRSTSHSSPLRHRQSKSDLGPLGLHPGPSTASIASTTSSYYHNRESREVELAHEREDFSEELSNLPVDSEEGLLLFQAGKLLEKDQAWHRLVPPEAIKALGDREVRRQSVIFEVFKAEREYVSDLEAIEEVFIKGLQNASPSVIPRDRLPIFLSDMFGNVGSILEHHRRMLRALFQRQREQHPLIQSVADIILDTVLMSEFRTDYDVYIKNYPLSQSHHRTELRQNPAYQAFLGSVSSDPRIRKRDFVTFISRPVTRLPRLSLVLEQILKSTDKEHDHPDLETLPIVLGILGDSIKGTQPGIEATESKVKFWELCESLVFQPGEIINMDLYDESRTVVYSGPVSRMIDYDWSDLTGSLLDNFFLLTRDEKRPDGTEKRYIMSRPLHLSYIRLGSFTLPPESRKERPEGILDTFRSSPVIPLYPFTIYHAASKSIRHYTLYAASESIRKRWHSAFVDAIGVHQARQDGNMWLYQQSLTDHFFRSIGPQFSHGLSSQLSGRITTSVPFSSGGRRFLAVGCATGIYVSPRGSEKYCQIFKFSNLTALAAIQTVGNRVFNKLIVQSETSLFAYSLDAIAQVVLGAAQPNAIESSAERVVAHDTPVFFFKPVCVGERVLIIYGTKKFLHISLTLQAVEAVPGSPGITSPRQTASPSLHSFRPFGELAYVPRDAYDIIPLVKTVGLCSKDGIIIIDPTNASKPLVTVVPNMENVGSNPSVDNLKTRLGDAKPLGLVRVPPKELLVIYNTMGCYITNRGVPSRSAGFIKWETPAKSYASRGNNILLFSSGFIEIRNVNTGQIVQVIEGLDIRLLHSGGAANEDNAILVAMKGSRDDRNGTSEKIIELVETPEFVSPLSIEPTPSLWDEWDM